MLTLRPVSVDQLAEQFMEAAIKKNDGSCIFQLEEFAKEKGLSKPEYKVSSRKIKEGPLVTYAFNSYVKVEDFSFSGYPEEASTPELAKEIAAKRALSELSTMDSGVGGKGTVDPDTVMSRVLEVEDFSFSGYPEEASTPELAKEIAAKRALSELSTMDSGVGGKGTVDPDTVMSRVLEVEDFSFSGYPEEASTPELAKEIAAKRALSELSTMDSGVGGKGTVDPDTVMSRVLEVEDFSFSGYPEEASTPELAKEIAAKRALSELSTMDSGVGGKGTVDPDTVMSRVLEVEDFSFSGYPEEASTPELAKEIAAKRALSELSTMDSGVGGKGTVDPDTVMSRVLEVEDFSFSGYPEEASTPELAKEIAAKRALSELSTMDSGVGGKGTVDPDTVMSRVLEVEDFSFSGYPEEASTPELAKEIAAKRALSELSTMDSGVGGKGTVDPDTVMSRVLEVEDFSFSGYPEEASTPELAKEIAAKRALSELSTMDSGVGGKGTVDPDTVMSRVLEVEDFSFSGYPEEASTPELAKEIAAKRALSELSTMDSGVGGKGTVDPDTVMSRVLEVEDFSFSGYPEEASTPELAKEIAAKRALSELSTMDSGVGGKGTVDPDTVMSRVLEVEDFSFSGYPEEASTPELAKEIAAKRALSELSTMDSGVGGKGTVDPDTVMSRVLEVEDFSFSGYPEEASTPELAKEIAAKRALSELSTMDSGVGGKGTVDPDTVMSRVLEVEDFSFSGYPEEASTPELAKEIAAKRALSELSTMDSGVGGKGTVDPDTVMSRVLEIAASGPPLRNVEALQNHKKQSLLQFQGAVAPEPLTLPQEDTWDIFVIFAPSTTEVWGRILGDDYSVLYDNISFDMELHYAGDSTPLTNLEEGSFYAVKLDDCWYRCEVLQIEDKMAKVFFIDHGDEEAVAIEDLRELERRFGSLPAQAVKLSLRGLESFATDPNASRHLGQIIGKSLVAQVHERPNEICDAVSVTIYDTSTDDDINMNSVLLDAISKDALAPQLPPAFFSTS